MRTPIPVCISIAMARAVGLPWLQRVVMIWEDCDLIERVPGKVSGRPVIKGTRVEPDTILTDLRMGSPVEEIQENFPTVPVETIWQLLQYAESLQAAQ
jgi:uncharacterized protein (DUF433 family)